MFADANIVAVLRHWNGTYAISAINNTDHDRNINLPVPSQMIAKKLVGAVSGTRVASSHRQIRLTSPALYGSVSIAR